MKRGNVGDAFDGTKPPIVTDMYRSTCVTGANAKVVSRSVPRTAIRGPVNQYGENRIIAGRKGKK